MATSPRVLIVAFLLCAGALAVPAQSQVPSVQEVLTCYLGPLLGPECDLAAAVDGITGAEPDPSGCSGTEIMGLLCLPGGVGAPGGECAEGELAVPVLGVCVPDPTAGGFPPELPIPGVGGGTCIAESLWSSGHGPILVTSDTDLMDPLAGLNGICPAAGGIPARVAAIDVDESLPPVSSDPTALLASTSSALIDVSGITQPFLLDGSTTNLIGFGDVVFTDVTGLTVQGVFGPDLTLRLVNVHDAIVASSSFGRIVVDGGSNVTIDASVLGGIGLPALEAYGPDGLVVRATTLLRASSGATAFLSGGRVGLAAVQFSGGSTPSGACLQATGMTELEVAALVFNSNCPAGLLDVAGATLELVGIVGTVTNTAPQAVRAIASTAGVYRLLTLEGGQNVLRTGGAGAWSLEASRLKGNAGLLAVQGTGAGSVSRNVLDGNGALVHAMNTAAPATPAPLLFADNRVQRSSGESVLADNGAFDANVALTLTRAKTLGNNTRGGPYIAGNWWDRSGVALWDGDGDGLAQQPLSVAGTAVTDTGALVPINRAPVLTAAMTPDPAHPFVRVFPGTPLHVEASALDADGGNVTVAWALDGNALSGGNKTDAVAGAAGAHTLVASALDPLGAVVTRSFAFTVLPANPAPTATGPFFGPCPTPTGQAPLLRVGLESCFRVGPADTATDDLLDLLYLDGGDNVVGLDDVRLGRSLDPPTAPGLVRLGFDLGAPLVPVTGAHLVLLDGAPALRLGAGNVLAAGDLLLGNGTQGARLQPHHAAVGRTATAPGCIALMVSDDGAYVDVNCDGLVSVTDLRLGNAPLIQSGDEDVGDALVAAPALVRRYDRDTHLSVLWDLATAASNQARDGPVVRITPIQSGTAVVTAVISDHGEVPAQLVLTAPVDIQSDVPPVADLAVTPSTNGKVSRLADVTLRDVSREAPATPITVRAWRVTGPSFGTPFASTAAAPVLQFTHLGIHTVNLTVTAANGLGHSKESTVLVVPAPPTPVFDFAPEAPQVAGSEIAFSAVGSNDLDAPLGALAGLSLVRQVTTGGLTVWVVDTDNDLVVDDTELLLGLAPGANGTAYVGVAATNMTVRACLADRDGNGVASRGEGLEQLFLSRTACTTTGTGMLRLQAVAGSIGADRFGETFLGPGHGDLGLALTPVSSATLGRATGAADAIALDLDGDHVLEAEDVRLGSFHGHSAGSRVVPSSFADGGGALDYVWTCRIGCGSGPTVMSTHATVDYAFDSSGIKIVQLSVSDGTGTVRSQEQELSVRNAAPSAFAFATPASGSTLQTFLFDATPSLDLDGGPSAMTYHWDFGDGTVAFNALPIVSKTYDEPGSYVVELTVVDSDELEPLEDSFTFVVHVSNALPVPSFVHLPLAPKTLTPVAFDGRGSVDLDGLIPSPLGYRWSIVEGTTTTVVTGPLASHSFGRAGTYNVTLQVTDDRGGIAELKRPITIANREPTAVIAINKTIGRAPQVIGFSSDGSSDPEFPQANGLASTVWDFGDGSPTVNQPNPSHTYTRRGVFTVRLTVTDREGASVQARVNVTMINEPAIASLIMPANGLVGQALSMSALGFDQDGDAITYQWDFGDGATATGSSVSHTYTTHGARTIQVRAQDAGGGETLVTKLLLIRSPAPTATLKADVLAVRINQDVRFTGSATDADGQVKGHFLEFGDGTSTFANNATHAFSKPGNYTVTYRATDNAGEAGSATVRVTVTNPAPIIAAVQVNPAVSKPGDLLLFRANVTDEEAGVTYRWDFKDGTLSEAATPVHVYRVAGTFNVVLTVTDAQGARSTKAFDVVVTGKPAVIDPDDSTACPVKDTGLLDEGAGTSCEDDPAAVDRVGRQDLPAPGVLGALAVLAAVALLLRRRRDEA